ncbi:MAG TPA: nitroreductase family protein, partial [Candidatus Goldiibacteriota bacterium]|nr:nitroreductase family protein [Candidatus Goldiibacteriota bacterium]
MDVKEALEKRRAYRSLEPVGISDDVVEQLAKAAWLMPSCFNNQPWRFIFIRSKEQLARMKEAINKGNEWTQAASMLIAVMARKEKD